MMGKGARGPKGGRPGGRKGKGGIGPGPGYKPSSTGGGTRHQPGTSSSGCAVMAVTLATVPVVTLAAVGYAVADVLS